jgi:transglutaminase-like putative cysteine protease
MQLEVQHQTYYRYASPVALAHHVAYLQPLHDKHQQLQSFEMHIEPAATHRHDSRDMLGNAVRSFSLARAHEELSVRATSRVQLRPRFAALDASASPPWDALAQSLRYVAGARFEPAVEFVMPSPFVPRLAELRGYAAASFAPGRPAAAAALHLMQRLHSDWTYESRSTEVDTPLAQVFAQRRGVCQDFAHLMIGALRLFGLPARYVSGYLLTQAPEDGALMLGADASHAWVQLWCPSTPGVPGPSGESWLDLDPTNNTVPGSGHVRLAVGRDFGDVTPLRGVIRGGGRHTLEVAVATRRLDEG